MIQWLKHIILTVACFEKSFEKDFISQDVLHMRDPLYRYTKEGIAYSFDQGSKLLHTTDQLHKWLDPFEESSFT